MNFVYIFPLAASLVSITLVSGGGGGALLQNSSSSPIFTKTPASLERDLFNGN